MRPTRLRAAFLPLFTGLAGPAWALAATFAVVVLAACATTVPAG